MAVQVILRIWTLRNVIVFSEAKVLIAEPDTWIAGIVQIMGPRCQHTALKWQARLSGPTFLKALLSKTARFSWRTILHRMLAVPPWGSWLTILFYHIVPTVLFYHELNTEVTKGHNRNRERTVLWQNGSQAFWVETHDLGFRTSKIIKSSVKTSSASKDLPLHLRTKWMWIPFKAAPLSSLRFHSYSPPKKMEHSNLFLNIKRFINSTIPLYPIDRVSKLFV